MACGSLVHLWVVVSSCVEVGAGGGGGSGAVGLMAVQLRSQVPAEMDAHRPGLDATALAQKPARSEHCAATRAGESTSECTSTVTVIAIDASSRDNLGRRR